MKRDGKCAHRGFVSLWGHLMVFYNHMFCFYNEKKILKKKIHQEKNVYKETLRDPGENCSTLFL